MSERGLRLRIVISTGILCLPLLAQSCAARLEGETPSRGEIEEAVTPFFGEWRFVSAGMLGGAESTKGEPNRMRIARREGYICFTLLSPEGNRLHDQCFSTDDWTESGGWKRKVILSVDGIRVRALRVENVPGDCSSESLFLYRIMSPQGTLLVESWWRCALGLGVYEEGWRSSGYSVYERLGERAR